MMYELIPDELRKLNQWGLFHREWVEKRGKYTKIPINPWDGKNGKSNDQSTWSDFDTAIRALDVFPQADGLAFYFANGYVGLDIDHIADELEKVKEGDQSMDNLVIQAEHLTKNTYMELSMSGEGIHAIFKGKITGNRRRKGNFELYQSGRFFALTGNVLRGKRDIQSLNEKEMATLYSHYFHEENVVEFPKKANIDFQPNNLTEAEVMDRALKSSTGGRFKVFVEGGWEQFYPSQSEADLAFANDLAFWTGRDFKQMDSIFRKSSLMRPKYDEKHGKTTYGVALLNKAISEASDVYTPSQRKPHLHYDLSFLKKDRDKPKPPRGWNDMGNALRMTDRYGKIIGYSYVDKVWWYYDGTQWLVDDEGKIEKLADKTVEAMADEKVVIAPGVDEEEAMTKWNKFKEKSKSNRSKKAMLDEVKHHVAVKHGDFDKEKMLINTVSGYVDLSSGILKDHDVDKHFSKKTNAEYTDNIDCPEWEHFLNQIFDGDEETIHYIQKAVGYSATGSTREQVMFFLYGNGRNGKSLFINTIADVLGSYAKTMNVESIMVKHASGNANSDIARLEGARMVVSSEANEGSRLDEGLVKQLTGGDKVVARQLYGKEFEFSPQFKLWMATNHQPLIRGTDDGIWRRINLIPFKVQIPEDQVDKDLKYKLQRENAGIMKWIVEGAMMWQREGLNPPQSVLDASNEYRDEMDVISLFIDDCCETGENYQAPAGELFKKYQEWAKESSEYSMSKQKFGREMRKKFKYKRMSNGRFYVGLKINVEPRLTFNQQV
ncbi:DNA primase [Limosilactobacillus fermentum]